MENRSYMSKELVTIVDEQDNILGVKARDDLGSKDIVRISVLWIENSKGQVLLQQRSLAKKTGPGKWGPAVAGTVESHETYASNIIKEAEEEIGLTGITPIEVGKHFYRERMDRLGVYLPFTK